MKVDDKILKDVLQRKIAQISELKKSSQKEVEQWMAEKYHVKYSTVVNIFNGKAPIESQNYDMLYKLMKSIRDALADKWADIDLSELNENTYFTEVEIEQFSIPMENNTGEEDLIFTEWFQLNNDFYCCRGNINMIHSCRNYNRFNYNPKTQRTMTIKESKGIVIKVVTLFTKSLKQIFKLMSNNEFISGDITLNMNPDISEGVIISNGKLIIPQAATVDIIDGFHQYVEMCEVKDKKPEWDYNTVVYVAMFNEEKANKYIYQKDKKNHLTEEQTIKIDPNNESNYVVNRLNESSTFHLKGSITDDKYMAINKIITKVFKPTVRKESYNTYELIEKNMNELVEKMNYFDKTITQEEWFIYLYLINYANTHNLDFMSLARSIDIYDLCNSINSAISFKKEPSISHYRLLEKTIKEVKKNEQNV